MMKRVAILLGVILVLGCGARQGPKPDGGQQVVLSDYDLTFQAPSSAWKVSLDPQLRSPGAVKGHAVLFHRKTGAYITVTVLRTYQPTLELAEDFRKKAKENLYASSVSQVNPDARAGLASFRVDMRMGCQAYAGRVVFSRVAYRADLTVVIQSSGPAKQFSEVSAAVDRVVRTLRVIK